MKADEIKKAVRSGYAKVALRNVSCCGSKASCCGSGGALEQISRKVGYRDEEFNAVPEGANLGLGCGNPVALASLSPGETVIDLGSGAGFDCFIAAAQVGRSGKVIGIDMTPEMVEKARQNALKGEFENVEFRLGEIERVPVPEGHADVVISNCVINLSPDKKQVFREAYRILKPRGRLMVSDIVLLRELPEAIRSSVEAYVGCIAGAERKDDYLAWLEAAGFQEIKVIAEDTLPIELVGADPVAQAVYAGLNLSVEKAGDLLTSVVSVKVSAVKAAKKDAV